VAGLKEIFMKRIQPSKSLKGGESMAADPRTGFLYPIGYWHSRLNLAIQVIPDSESIAKSMLLGLVEVLPQLAGAFPEAVGDQPTPKPWKPKLVG
jgi:hypothetical protein